jgi:hypothetical protein
MHLLALGASFAVLAPGRLYQNALRKISSICR